MMHLPYIYIYIQEDSPTEKKILCISPHSNFMKNTIGFDVSDGVNVWFVRRLLWVHRAFKILLQFLDLQSEHQVSLNFFFSFFFFLFFFFFGGGGGYFNKPNMPICSFDNCDGLLKTWFYGTAGKKRAAVVFEICVTEIAQ